MALPKAKRKYVRRPGVVAGAAALGCTISHLRRVLIGERMGKRLTIRFREWEKQQRADATPISLSRLVERPGQESNTNNKQHQPPKQQLKL